MSYIGQSTRKKRDRIDIIRVKLWYEEVRYRLSLNTAYQIEKAIEPMAFGKNEYGDPYHNNKWSGYAAGRHTPNKQLVALVELRLRGSSDVLNSFFWEALRGRQDIDWLIKEGVRSLSWEVQKVLHKYNKNGFSSELFSLLCTKELLRLERLAGLDSLAALIIFLRIADSKDYRASTFDIGRSIYRTLLLMCTFQPYQTLSVELLQLMKLYVFPLAHNGVKSVAVESEEGFLLEINYLNRLLLQSEGGSTDINQKEKVRIMLEIIYGKRDFRHKFIFFVPFEFRDESSTVKPMYLLDLQNVKKGIIECLKRDIVPLSEASVDFFHLNV